MTELNSTSMFESNKKPQRTIANQMSQIST